MKANVDIQVIANGDIRSVDDVQSVLSQSGADGVMIGRASMGNPWLFRQIRHYLETGEKLATPELHEIADVVESHIQEIHEHYGDYLGLVLPASISINTATGFLNLKNFAKGFVV